MHLVSWRPRIWAVSFLAIATATAVISAMTQGEPLEAADVRVNTTTANDQTGAAVARDPDGDFVIAWSGASATDGGDIFFQRYHRNGTAQGSQTTVNTTTPGLQRNPSVAMDASGNFVVAWETCANANGTSCDIAFRRYSADGQAQGLETTANATTTDEQTLPALGVAANGTFVIAWQSLGQDGSGQGIYARRFTALGLPSDLMDVAVNTTTANSQSDPALAINASGAFVVAWTSSDGTGNATGIFAQAFTAAGAKAGAEFRANVTVAGTQAAPAVGMAADGSFVIAWEGPDADGTGIYMMRYDSARTALGSADEAVNATTTGNQRSASVAVDASGDIVVAWAGADASPDGIYFQRFDAAGAAQGAETAANVTTAGDQAFPAVAADADGDFVIAWQSFGSDYDIYQRRFAGPEDVNLRVTKTDSADPVARSTAYSYAITVENLSAAAGATGERSATGVTVVDTLPAGVSYSSFDSTTGTWNCANASGTVTCELQDALAPGGTAVVTLNVTSPPGDGQPLNSVTVAGDQYESDTSDNSDTEDTYVCATAIPGTLAFASDTYTVLEDGDDDGGNNDGLATITVSRSGGSCGRVTVEVGSSDDTATAGQDYTAVPAGTTLTWESGDQTDKTFTVGITDDTTDEVAETLNLALSNPTRATLGTQTTATLTINDNDDPPAMTLSVTGSPFSENGGTATVTATLAAVSTKEAVVTLSFGSGAGTANRGTGCGGTVVSPADYTCSGNTITIPAGQTTGSVTLTGANDSLDEEDQENIPISANCNANCTVSGAAPQVTAQVADDDAVPEVQFSAASSSTAEDTTPPLGTPTATTATITLQLSAASSRTVSVDYSIAGTATRLDDYTTNPAPASGTITFAAGQTSRTITVTTVVDATDENDETVIVTLTNPGNATVGTINPHTLTITDNDAPPTVQFTPNSTSVTEGDSGSTAVTATAVLSAASGRDVSVPFGVGGTAVANPAPDHDAQAGVIMIPAGQETGSYTFNVFGDTVNEGNDTVTLTMGTPTNATVGANGTHTTTISNDDPTPTAQIDVANSTTTIAESGGTATIVVTLTPASGRTATVSYSLGGTATSGSGNDYTISPASPISFAIGETSKTLTVTVNNDTADEPNSETVILTLGATGTAALGSPSTHTLTITDDDDQPQVSFTAASAARAEDAGMSLATLQLSRTTSSDVTVPFSVGGSAAGNDYALLCPDGLGGTTPCAGEVIIPAGQLSASITIDVTADSRVEPDETVVLTMGTPTNATAQAPTSHTLTLQNDDTAGFVLDESGGTAVAEGGAGDSYTLVLTSEPAADVTVNLAHGAEVTTPASLTFTSANWDTPQTVTVDAVDDAVAEGPHTDTIMHSVSSSDTDYSNAGTPVPDVVVSITDNDTPAIVLTESGGGTAVTEGGATDSYTLVLTTQPTDDVTIAVTPDAQLGVNPVSVTFTPANWDTPQTVTVNAVDDDVAEGAHTGVIMHAVTSPDGSYDGMALRDVSADITDNETAGVVVTESGGSTAVTEGGATDTYTLVLSSEPAADVTIDLTTGGQVSVNPASVTFTAVNWNMAVTVTVTAVDDAAAEGAHADTITHAATSADPAYDGIAVADVDAAITDNDVTGVTVTESGGSTDVAEGGATDSYTLVLTSQPSADVTITIAGDADVDADLASVTFTSADWDMPQTVTVTAVDDAAAEGTHTGTITHSASSADAGYDGAAVPDVVANITDNETAGVAITESGGNTAVAEGGAGDSYTVVLTSQPTSDVVITLETGGQATAAPASLTFTPFDWFMAQTVTVDAVEDDVAEGTHGDTVTHVAASSDPDYNGAPVAPVTVTISDNDTVGITVTESGGSTDVAEGGATDTYTLVLTSQPTANVTITMNGDADVSAAPVSVTFTAADWNVPQEITISAVDDEIVEGGHTGTMSHDVASADPAYNGLAAADVTATIADNDTGGIVLTESGGDTAVAEGGTTDSYTLVLTSQPTADVTIAISGDGQVTPIPALVTFTPANWNVPRTVAVSAVDDRTVEGDHFGTLMHAVSSADPVYDGMAVADVTAAITDNDTAGVAVSETGGSTAVTEGGASDTYTLVLTSQPSADVTITLSTGAEITVAPTTLTFTPANFATPQTVTVTAVDDSLVENAETDRVDGDMTSTDPMYNGALAPVNVAVGDNDSVTSGEQTPAVVVTYTGGSVNVAPASEQGGGALSWSGLAGLLALLGLRRRRALLAAAAVIAAGFSTAATAQVFSYSNLDLRYLQASVDDPAVDASGFALGGSWDLGKKNIFLSANYAAVETDDFTAFGVTGSSKTTSTSLGVGTYHSLERDLDLTGALSLVMAESEGQGNFTGSADDTGFALEAGLRGLKSPTFEWGVALGYTSIFDDSSTSLSAQALFHAGARFSFVAGAGLSEDGNQFNLGLRYRLGGTAMRYPTTGRKRR